MGSYPISYLLDDFWQVICQRLCLNFLTFLSFLSLFFLAVLGLHGCTGAFSGCVGSLMLCGGFSRVVRRGYFLIVVCGLLVAVTSVTEHGLSGVAFSVCSSLALEHELSSCGA